ncbi:SGNH/GDSL hydrolase family protein [Methylobacterium sp. P31]
MAARHWRHGLTIRRRLAERRPGIRAALRAASPDSVLLAGNSHAEFLGTLDFGTRPSLNLGIGRGTAADWAAYLASLRVPVRCAASVLIIGTNDILRWRHPERRRIQDRFEADTRRILRVLDAWSAQVYVAAIPPIGAWATGRDPAAVAVFSDRLAALCAERGCRFFDPFATLRAGDAGFAGAGLSRDGVHLADYTRLAAEIVRLVDLDLIPSGLRAHRTADPPPEPADGLYALPAAAWGVLP